MSCMGGVLEHTLAANGGIEHDLRPLMHRLGDRTKSLMPFT